MERIRRIMVAYDFSEYSKEALKYAVELAEVLTSDLIVVNVIDQRDVDAIRMERWLAPLSQRRRL